MIVEQLTDNFYRTRRETDDPGTFILLSNATKIDKRLAKFFESCGQKVIREKRSRKIIL